MSSTLYWNIIPAGYSLPMELKWKLEKKYSLPRLFDFNDLDYLRGLDDCGILGASVLINAIEKYEKIEVRLEE